MQEKTATSDSLEPERLTFNPTTHETKVWGCRTDDPAWDRDIDDPVAVYTPTDVPRGVFDLLPPGPQVVIVTDRQKAGVGWRQVDRRWESYSLDHRRERRGAVLHTRSTPRRRGAGRPAVRGSSRRSSARSGDSGEDGESPEPPPAGRLCRCGCGRDLTHLRRDAKFFEDACRKREQRDRDRANPERVAERSAARQRAEKQIEVSGSGPCPGPKVAVGRCGAKLVSRDPEGGVWCVLCGVPRGPLTSPNGFDATAAGMMQVDKLTVRRPSPREWKTRPNRSEAARLRKTRREFVDESIIRGAAA